jgi:hypothetical protein
MSEDMFKLTVSLVLSLSGFFLSPLAFIHHVLDELGVLRATLPPGFDDEARPSGEDLWSQRRLAPATSSTQVKIWNVAVVGAYGVGRASLAVQVDMVFCIVNHS